MKHNDAPWQSWATLALLVISWFAAIAFFFLLDWQRAVACLMVSATLLPIVAECCAHSAFGAWAYGG